MIQQLVDAKGLYALIGDCEFLARKYIFPSGGAESGAESQLLASETRYRRPVPVRRVTAI